MIFLRNIHAVRAASCSIFLLFALALSAQERSERALVDRLKELNNNAEGEALQRTADRVLDSLPSGPSALRQDAEFYLALALQLNGDALEAVRHAQQAVLTARAMGDTSRILRSMYLIMKLNVEGHHYDEADRNRRDNYELARTYGKDTLELVRALNAMGSMYNRLERSDSAEQFYREGLRVLGERPDPIRVVMMSNLASTISLSGKHEESARLHRQVLQELDSTNLRTRAWAYSSLGESLLLAGRYREAIAAFDTSDAVNQRCGNALDLAIDLGELRAQCMDSLGDIAGAYFWTKHVRDLQDTLYERSMSEQLVELEKKFETRLNKEEIQRLDAENEQKAERIRAQKLQLYGSLAVAALALGGVLLVWRNLRQRRKHQVVLEGLNSELHEQKARIEEINGLLRLKVLRTQMDPHFIHNCLNAIRALSLKGEHERAEEYLEGFARILRNVLEHSVRDRITLDEEIAFLNDYVRLEQLRLGNDLTWSITADDALLNEEPQVPSLLVQPFVENAIWHGLAPKQGPKHLAIHFFQVDGVVTCRVQDNGVGRTEKAPTPGRTSLGLKLTGERLELLTERMRSAGGFRVEDLKDPGGAPAGTLVEMRFAG
jgi:tetratricopeptide (TPR) repeat protein